MILPGGVTLNLLVAIFAGAFGSAFQHGYNTGVLNEIQNVTQEWIRGCKDNSQDCNYTLVETTFIWAWIVSIFCLGGMAGGLTVGIVANGFGRKRSLLLNNLFIFLGGSMMALAKYLESYPVLIGGRFFIGVSSGFAAGLTPMYLSEISPASIRGATGTMYQVIITWSILISQLLGVSNMLGTIDLWPWLLACTMVPGIIQCVVLPFCPESPSFLFIGKNDESGAIKALQWLRSKKEVTDEMEVIRQEKESQKKGSVTFVGLFQNRALRRPLMIAIMLMLAQQMTGINAIMFYSTDVFSGAGLSQENAQFATIGLGLANVVMTIFAIFIIEKAGRKTLLLVGLCGMLISTVGLLACLIMTKKDPKEEAEEEDESKQGSSFLSMFSIVTLLSYIMFFAIGPGPIPWFFVSELFAQNARPAATSIAVGVNWFANFIVTWGFQPIAAAVGPYVFVVFIILMIIFIIYTWYYVPETKDKTTLEITEQFK